MSYADTANASRTESSPVVANTTVTPSALVSPLELRACQGATTAFTR